MSAYPDSFATSPITETHTRLRLARAPIHGRRLRTAFLDRGLAFVFLGVGCCFGITFRHLKNFSGMVRSGRGPANGEASGASSAVHKTTKSLKSKSPKGGLSSALMVTCSPVELSQLMAS